MVQNAFGLRKPERTTDLQTIFSQNQIQVEVKLGILVFFRDGGGEVHISAREQ